MSHLNAVVDGGDNFLDGRIDSDAVVLCAVPVSEGNSPRGDVIVAGDQHVGSLGSLRVADLLLHPIIGGVDLHANAPLAQRGSDLLEVVHV